MASTDKPVAKEAAASTAPSEESKAKFREALERTKAAHHRHNDGQRNTGAVHGSETAGPAQKMFRRKSGG
ncbi:hypothetical protein Xcel_2088 [Xylanimonas cellulosilytica DSM 15894]|uniref:DUF5302 domain-containing protein n=1 Tax=Xylanimonas cellulosilytica (strain DSM 15894 / JCM 12276 / CECT 5975 / KCTC 9989 / LMG 20990 / NBRC 107835 / XIL07) TaxID=446471 RepID=D1BU93_XYLCX|nr:DUF5302 domain-containing protein [Xylanimonas cellulosilytica]ACZ31106.1 hypothetical protein Xcel_2088 [Xylanimonas cellulosilytica DSM 15894]